MSVLPGCNGWLDDVQQTSKVTEEIVWENEASVDNYVNSFYVLLHDYGQFGTAQFQGSLTESLTDSFKYGSVTLGNRAGNSNNYVTNPDAISSDGGLYSIWANGKAYHYKQGLYQAILFYWRSSVAWPPFWYKDR